jgi:hypothetical protein
MWRKEINHMIAPLDLNSEQCIGIQIMTSPETYVYLIQVYLPCKNHSMMSYSTYVEELENVICKFISKGTVIILGDFNTELPSVRSSDTVIDSRGVKLLDITSNYNLTSLTTSSMCQGCIYSNVPYNSCRETLIDHIFVPEWSLQNFIQCEIIEDNSLCVSTHRPIVCKYVIPRIECTRPRERKDVINWHNVKSKNLEDYETFLENSDVLHLANKMPTRSISDIDEFYSGIVVIVNLAID